MYKPIISINDINIEFVINTLKLKVEKIIIQDKEFIMNDDYKNERLIYVFNNINKYRETPIYLQLLYMFVFNDFEFFKSCKSQYPLLYINYII